MRYDDFDDDFPVEKENIKVQTDRVYSVKQWFGTLLLMLIPGVNIILLFIWAFSNKVNKNKKNWAIASLFMCVVVIVLLAVACYIAYNMFISMFNSLFGE